MTKTIRLTTTTLILALLQTVAAADRQAAIVERGPHHRVIETTVRNGPPDQPTIQKSVTVEMATGLHYVDNGQWADSIEVIEPVAGGAVAHHGQIKAAFAANLNTVGAIQVVDADGGQFTSHVLGIAYTDETSGKSILIGQ